MGKPNIRLNPQIRSELVRTLYKSPVELLLSVVTLLPTNEVNCSGPKPYDHRLVLVLNILRALLRKTYEDYETEMRRDPRFKGWLNMTCLPSKSILHWNMQKLSLNQLVRFNRRLVDTWVKKTCWFIIGCFRHPTCWKKYLIFYKNQKENPEERLW